MTLNDLTLIDMHEALAAQTLTNLKMFASKKFAQEKQDVMRQLARLTRRNLMSWVALLLTGTPLQRPVHG